MILTWVRRLPRPAVFLIFFLFGSGPYTWIQWRLDRIFVKTDPSGLTRPLIVWPD